MRKVFDPKNRHNLDNPKRRKLMPPETILEMFDLDKGHVFLDIGAGIGYFTIPALKRVSNNGKVIAADISDEMLLEIEKKTGDPHNLLLLEVSESEILLPSSSVDRVLMSMVLHEIDNKEDYLKNIKDIMKDDGYLIIIEWKKIDTKRGPHKKHRISEDELKELTKKVGLSLLETHDYEHLYVSLFKI